MMTLAAEKRDPEVKAKKLRREGYTTGVLYGREMKENVALKYAEKDALNFIKKAKEGAQTMLDISGEKVDALVKNIDYDPLSKKILALDFQALVAGEVVAATVPVTFVNEEVVQGVFEPEITEIHYKADPAHLLDPIEIDLAKLPQGTRTLYVKDLKLEEKGVTAGDNLGKLIEGIPQQVYDAEGGNLSEIVRNYTWFDSDEVTEDAAITLRMGYEAI